MAVVSGKPRALDNGVTVELAVWQQMLASGTGALLTSLSSQTFVSKKKKKKKKPPLTVKPVAAVTPFDVVKTRLQMQFSSTMAGMRCAQCYIVSNGISDFISPCPTPAHHPMQFTGTVVRSALEPGTLGSLAVRCRMHSAR